MAPLSTRSLELLLLNVSLPPHEASPGIVSLVISEK